MIIKKKSLVVVISFVLVLVLMYIVGINLTGNVVWEPVADVNNCSDKNIENLWNEIFVKNYSGFMIIDDGISGDCAKIAIKIDGSQLWIFNINFWGSFGIFDVRGTDYVSINYTLVNGLYANATFDIISEYGTPVTLNDVEDIHDGVFGGINFENVTNWSILNEGVAKTEFSNWFNVVPDSLSDNGDEFDNNENSFFNLIYDDSQWYILKNKSAAVYGFQRLYVREIVPATFQKDIPNYILQINTSWNNVSNVSEFIDMLPGDVATLDWVGGNTTHSIINNGMMSFDTDNKSEGVAYFVLNVEYNSGTVSSNEFNVTLVIDINDKPTQIQNFKNVVIAKGAKLTYDLTKYFQDPEGSKLTYNERGDTDDLIIIIVNDTMTIQVNGSLGERAEIWLYASDGELKKKSNKFYISEPDSNVTVSFNNTQNTTNDPDATTTTGTTGGSTTGTSGNSTGADDEDSESGDVNWALWISILIVVIGTILFSIWYFVLREHDEGVPRDGGSELITAPTDTITPNIPTVKNNASMHPVKNKSTDPAPVKVPAKSNVSVRVPVKDSVKNDIPIPTDATVKSPVNDYLSKLNLDKK